MHNEDSDATPPQGVSLIGIALEGLARRLGALAGDVAEASKLAPALSGDALDAFLSECIDSSRDLGDYGHELARNLADIQRAAKAKRQ